MPNNFIPMIIFLAGFIIGLGAVTIIDMLGFLGRKSTYWTETTIRTHKVTKPLIWLGMILAILGGILFYQNIGWNMFAKAHAILAIALVTNGMFLSFYVSPYLLKQEKSGQAKTLLPKHLQYKIAISFVVSFVGWWASVAILAWQVA